MINKEAIKNIIMVIIGNFILAFGIAFFIVPNAIVTGGVTGLATIFFPDGSDVMVYFIYAIEALLFFLGLFFLGKKFAAKTFLSVILYPTFLLFLKPIGMEMRITGNDLFLSSIYGGIILGVGVGIVFRAGGSTGGTDIPPLIINKYTKLPVDRLVLLTDGLIVLLGMKIRGFKPALIGLFSVYLCSVMVNKMMTLGMEKAKSLMIISDKYEEIMDKLQSQIGRGATLLKGEGGYTKQPKEVLMVVISNKQFNSTSEIIKSIDPNAFVIVHDVNEVQGEGFSYYPE